MAKLGTQVLIFILKLNEVKEKKYSKEECSERDIYVFSSKSEFYEYYLMHGLNIKNKEILDKAIFTRLKNGDIIALKGLCDYIITKSTDRYMSLEEIEEIHARGNLTPFELVNKWESFDICPVGDANGSMEDRCNKFNNNCHECLMEQAKILNEGPSKVKKHFGFKNN